MKKHAVVDWFDYSYEDIATAQDVMQMQFEEDITSMEFFFDSIGCKVSWDYDHQSPQVTGVDIYLADNIADLYIEQAYEDIMKMREPKSDGYWIAEGLIDWFYNDTDIINLLAELRDITVVYREQVDRLEGFEGDYGYWGYNRKQQDVLCEWRDKCDPVVARIESELWTLAARALKDADEDYDSGIGQYLEEECTPLSEQDDEDE